MRKQRLLWIVALSLILSLSLTRPAYAYMDPGTTGSIFAMLAPFITIFLAVLAVLIRPFRIFVVSLFAKLRGKLGTESQASEELPESADPSNDEESRKSTSEDT
ncbi:hypothetical protein ACFLVX_01840 [Chloroflexota bacterium]